MKFAESFMKAKIGMNAHTLIPLFVLPALFAALAACQPRPADIYDVPEVGGPESSTAPVDPLSQPVSYTHQDRWFDFDVVYDNSNESTRLRQSVEFFSDPDTGCKYMNIIRQPYGSTAGFIPPMMTTVKRELPCTGPVAK